MNKEKKPCINMPSNLIDRQGFHQQAVIHPAVVETFMRIIGKHGVKLMKKPFLRFQCRMDCTMARV